MTLTPYQKPLLVEGSGGPVYTQADAGPPVPPIGSSRAICRESLPELQSKSGTGNIGLPAPFCFRGSCWRYRNGCSETISAARDKPLRQKPNSHLLERRERTEGNRGGRGCAGRRFHR